MDCEIHKGDGKSEEIIEDELVFVDIPEFSCFNILGDATIETSQLIYDDKKDLHYMKLSLNVPNEDVILFHLEGKRIETKGTCMFFKVFEEKDTSEEDKLKISDINYIGYCKYVSQLYIKRPDEI
ncbi:hypothetical protein cand_028720 [Cryptosporidium andersoni]|uniref:Uncharacterized protein n=1 Tax=Cryptosporidium andersoni TaxID=117008 RepID=A0A1J4MR08_9CRYT|nr:hypothetical protein cand_028720 [Cryptosporidium andersoni]